MLREGERETAALLESTQGSYVRPPREQCKEKRWETPADDSNTIRTQTLIWTQNGRLVEFVVNLQVLTSDGWETIEYIDCCHGHCHRHSAGGAVQPIMQLDAVSDVKHAYSAAQPVITERIRIIRGK